EVSFTVISMSLSLIAVFTPILLMGGEVGQLFHEFALTLSIAVLISLVVSLTTTPMMCAFLVHSHAEDKKPNWIVRKSEAAFIRVHRLYDRSLQWALANPLTIMFILIVTVCVNVYLFTIIPYGFFPQQDTGRLVGGIRADQSISFQAMEQKFRALAAIVGKDKDVQDVVGFTGGGGGRGGGATNTGFMFVSLKPLSERNASSDQIIARLRKATAGISGARLFFQAVQDIHIGGRQSNAQYQYTIQADTLEELNAWAPKINAAFQDIPELEDVSSDQQDKGLEVDLKIDRPTAARLGITLSQIDNTLYDAFGQRQVSTIYNALNQYHVVMEVAPQFWQNPDTLNDIYVSTSAATPSGTQSTAAVAGSTVISASGGGSAAASTSTATSSASTPQTAAQIAAQSVKNLQLNALTNSARGGASAGSSVATAVETMVPLAAFSSYGPGTTPLSINHQGPFVATTFSFNLPVGESLSVATDAIQSAMQNLHVPIAVHGSFAGTAQAFQSSLANEPVLILAAILAVYIVLGVLYESYIHPITILSTLPSAGVGAVFALLLFGSEFSLIALIGVILLIGIVKKNAIMMIDFALEAQRNGGMDAHQAIYRACLLRFRPIMMTTMAAMLGALPLALITGDGAELRQPLGISIVGGLLVSQLLTLYTTPVVYLYLDRFRERCRTAWLRWYNGLMGDDVPVQS
ncbi:MAG TPA: efflux RND transporter permease subunit, partial [Rhizomicrobium sp.]|nr:efflux RND transporter permease subunit [Rhizomicrobium sp.]